MGGVRFNVRVQKKNRLKGKKGLMDGMLGEGGQ